MTLNHIFQIHSVLLQHSTKDERHRGALKTLPNNVAVFDPQGNLLGIVFETTSPFDTEREMTALTDWLLRRELQRDLLRVDFDLLEPLLQHRFRAVLGSQHRQSQYLQPQKDILFSYKLVAIL